MGNHPIPPPHRILISFHFEVLGYHLSLIFMKIFNVCKKKKDASISYKDTNPTKICLFIGNNIHQIKWFYVENVLKCKMVE